MPAVVEAFRRPTQHDLTISVVTRQEVEFVDLTPSLSSLVEALGIRDGVLTVQTRHTSTGRMSNEHEPLLLDDLKAMFERLVPGEACYAHDDFSCRTVNLGPNERRNGHAHCRAAR